MNKIITNQEFIDFINSQPDNRSIDMLDDNGDGCGCVMIHYGQDVLKYSRPSAGTVCIWEKNNFDETVVQMEKDIFNFIPNSYWESIKNYGDVKKLLHN